MKMKVILFVIVATFGFFFTSCKEEKQETDAQRIIKTMEELRDSAESYAERESFGSIEAEIENYRKIISACEEISKKKCTWKESGYKPQENEQYIALEGKKYVLFISLISSYFKDCSGTTLKVSLDGIAVEDSENEKQKKECELLLEKFGVK